MKPQLTKEAFAEWCEKKPADEFYDYLSPDACAAAQYAAHLGMVYYEVYWGSAFWKDVDDIAMATRQRTFGALAKRLRGLP